MAAEQTPTNPHDDAFDALVADFGAPSIEAQQDTLDMMNITHRQQWQQAGILLKVVDAMHTAEGERELTLRRIYRKQDDGTEIEEHGFRVNYTETTFVDGDPLHKSLKISNSWIPVSQTLQGVRMPMGTFDEADADLIAKQIETLADMRETGELLNLSPDLGSIHNPATGIMASPHQSQGNT